MNFSKYFLILILISTFQNHAIVKQVSGVALAYYGLKEAWSVLRNPRVDDNYIAERQEIIDSIPLEYIRQSALDNYDLRANFKNLSYDLIKLFGCVYIAKKGIDLMGLK